MAIDHPRTENLHLNVALADQADPLLFGHDPTPGIVSVAADRQGRATICAALMERSSKRSIATRTGSFSPMPVCWMA